MFIRKLSAQNYRTLEDINLNLSTHYTALCGKNNCGKSNVLNIMRILLMDERDPRMWPFPPEASHSADYTAWKRKSAPNEPISLGISLELDSERDHGLIEFIRRLGKVIPQSGPEQTLQTQVEPTESQSEAVPTPIKREFSTLEINIVLSLTEPKRVLSVIYDGTQLDDVAANEILKKLRSSKALVFHNSTSTHHLLYRGEVLQGMLGKLSSEERTALTDKQNALSKQIQKIVEKHRQELETLIGRLNEKYEVRLSTAEIQLSDDWPVELQLGERDFAVPLEDWGSGTRNQTWILRTLFDAAKNAQKTLSSEKITPVVVIEEPESFLHPLAQARFGNVLQDLAEELEVQVIATTHSPYLLSHRDPKSNILLSREEAKRTRLPRSTKLVPLGEEEVSSDWRRPFEHALGVTGPEFNLFKDAVFSRATSILLVEGAIDKDYLNLCMDESHGSNRLSFNGEIFAYGGWSNLQNTVLLKFIRDRFSKVVITFDLDIESKVRATLERLDFIKDQTYFAIGHNSPGKRAIEGLLPDSIRIRVTSENPDLVTALGSDDDQERKKANDELKKRYLSEFKKSGSAGDDYSEFYKLTRRLNSAFQVRKRG